MTSENERLADELGELIPRFRDDQSIIDEAVKAIRAASVKAGEAVGEPVAWLRYAIEGDAPKPCNEDDDGAFPVYRAATPAPTASVGAMREALEFYANEWMGSVNELGAVVYEPTSALVEDQGKQADAALAAENQSDVEALAATTAERPGTVTSDPEPSTSDAYKDSALEAMLGRPYGQEKSDVRCAGSPCCWPNCGCGRTERL